MTLLAAIGSRFGNDAIALDLLQSLEPELRRRQNGLITLYCDNPLTDLLPALEPRQATILVDAVVGAGANGRVIEIDSAELLENPCPVSSHALSVASVLQLSQALGQLPDRLHILGICVDPERILDRQARQRARQELDDAIRRLTRGKVAADDPITRLSISA